MSASTAFLQTLKQRRSIYALGRKPLSLKKEEIAKLVKDTVRHCPSAYNVQSSRAVVLFGADHAKLWEFVIEGMVRHGVKGDALKEATEKVNNCFAAGVGSVLFFEDTAAIEALKKSIPAYAGYFDSFSLQASGMAQFAVWSALAAEKIGGSLQHYNALIEEAVRKEWKLPESWSLVSQLPFGSIEAPPGERTYIPDEGRVIVKGL